MIDFKKISEEDIHHKNPYIGLKSKKFMLPDGNELDFNVMTIDPAVSILPITTDNKIIIARQFRVGPEKILNELPGGVIEEGEDILKAAARELLEETGYAGEMEYVGHAWSLAYSEYDRKIVVARNCKKVEDQKLDAHEFIEVKELTLDEFRELLRSGELTDSISGYRGLEHLGLL